MKSIRSTLIAASLLAGLSGLAMSQSPAEAPTPGTRVDRMEKMHVKMGERHAKHLTNLKSKLSLQTSQEGAWAGFVQSMQKPERTARPDRASMDAMSTPERLDRMQAMMVERNVQMQKRIEGTKSFYTSLTAEQKQVFDKESVHAMGRMAGGMYRMKYAGPHHSMR